jgi:hypothetical protein
MTVQERAGLVVVDIDYRHCPGTLRTDDRLKKVNDTFHRGQVRKEYRRLLGCTELGKGTMDSLMLDLTECSGTSQR